MPPCNFSKINDHSAYLLWHIVEPERELLRKSDLSPAAQTTYQEIGHPRRRREWLAARLALKELLAKWGHEYTDLKKDACGRPHLANSGLYLSIAHNFPFSFAAVDHKNPIGIDIQLPCQKLQNAKEKFLNDEEIRDSGNNLEKLCIYWCAKEAIYKSKSRKNLSLKHDIRVNAFTKKDQGTLLGEIASKFFVTHYSFYDSHVLAWSREADTQEGISS